MAEEKKPSVLRFILGYAADYRKNFYWALLATLLATLFSFLTPQVIRLTIDSVISELPYGLPFGLSEFLESALPREVLRTKLYIPACAVAILAIGTLGTNFIRRYFIQIYAEGAVKKMREHLFRQTQQLPYAWHIRIQTGDVIQRCISDVETIRDFLANQFIELFRVITMIIMAVLMMLSIHVKLGMICIGFIPIILLYSNFFYSRVSFRFRQADEAEGQLMTAVQENLTGVRVVRAFGREAFEMEKFNRLNDHYTTMWVRLGKLMGAYWGTGEFVTGMQKVIVLTLGVSEVVKGNGLYLGGLIALMTYNTYLLWPIRGLGRILSDLSRTSVAADRIQEILNEAVEQDREEALDFEFKGELEFDGVTFGYGENNVLDDLSFRISAGESVAILGGTGSGKSTIAHLIPRLYELEEGSGTIRIDGVDVRDIKCSTLRKQIGLVLQEPFLFSRTIGENIRAANTDLSDAQLREYANTARIDQAILSFEKGYDTIVGERGVTLSGGQQQRVAIARTLSQDPKILIFDDSLSAVDTKTDAEIREALARQAKGVTTITISHRVTTLMRADSIIVLDKGKIVERGTHSQLMELGGIYRRIYDLQTGIDQELLKEAEA